MNDCVQCSVVSVQRFSESCTDRYSSQFENNYFTQMCSGSEAGSYLRLTDSASLNSRLGSNKEEEEVQRAGIGLGISVEGLQTSAVRGISSPLWTP